MQKDRKKGGKFKREKWKGGWGRIRDWDKEFKMINVLVFGNHKKIVHDSLQNQPWRAYYVSERSEPPRATRI